MCEESLISGQAAKKGPPVDGIQAYIVSVAVALAQMCVLGAFTSYPVYLSVLEKDKELGEPSQTTLAIPQSIVLGMIPTFGVAAGIVCDKYGPRPALFGAALALLLLGLLTPLAVSVEDFIITYSLTMGMSAACIVAPGPAALGTWFSEEKITIGIGIGEAGAALGTSVMPAIASALVAKYDGWREPFRIMSTFSIIAFLSVAVIRIRPGSQDEAHEEEVQEVNEMDSTSLSSLIKTRRFAGVLLGQTFFAYGYFSLLFMTIPYVEIFGKAGTPYEHRDSISLEDSSLLLTCFGIANGIGAVVIGVLAAKLNPRIVFVIAMPLLAVLLFLLTVAKTFAVLAVLFIGMGITCSAGLACLPSMVVEGFMGPHLNIMMSLSFVGFGVGGLCGPPISSALQSSSSDKSFAASIVIAGVSALLAAVAVFVGVGRSAPPPSEDDNDDLSSTRSLQ